MGTVLIGKITRGDLEKEPWYRESYDRARFDLKQVKALIKPMKTVMVKIYLGSWCGDTHEQVPAFMKLMDEAGVAAFQFELIALDRAKICPGFSNPDQILKLPTFVIFSDGKELGRIVERPHELLEQDLLAIFKL
jgi:thiol-disulfide isomerase/thioredoxin